MLSDFDPTFYFHFFKEILYIKKIVHLQSERDLFLLFKKHASERFRIFLKKSPLQRQMTVHNIKQCKKHYQKMNLVKKI